MEPTERIDLSTVTDVWIGNEHIPVVPGTFEVGNPVFTMGTGDNQRQVYGSYLHPLSYFFTEAGSERRFTGPWHAITQISHRTQPEPEPEAEPKHKLLPVGTRVLVHDLVWNEDTRKPEPTNPEPGKIVGYDMHRTKYRWRREWNYQEDRYSEHDQWAFADNRVQVHPDGPECLSDPEPVKREPTGPRVYVKHPRGKDGYVVEFGRKAEDEVAALVQWHTPGTVPVWVSMDRLAIIHPDDVDRCPNGQANDECGSGENQCEPCRQAEDAEGDAIEESMGLR